MERCGNKALHVPLATTYSDGNGVEQAQIQFINWTRHEQRSVGIEYIFGPLSHIYLYNPLSD